MSPHDRDRWGEYWRFTAQSLGSDELDHRDHRYQMLVAGRAVKRR